MNNYLQEHQLKANGIGNAGIRQMVNQSPIYNQLQMVNVSQIVPVSNLSVGVQRFKNKRSESVVTQRPPEISGSKNALAPGSLTRGRNTILVSGGAGPDSVKANQ